MNTNIKEHSEEIYKEIINANVDELKIFATSLATMSEVAALGINYINVDKQYIRAKNDLRNTFPLFNDEKGVRLARGIELEEHLRGIYIPIWTEKKDILENINKLLKGDE